MRRKRRRTGAGYDLLGVLLLLAHRCIDRGRADRLPLHGGGCVEGGWRMKLSDWTAYDTERLRRKVVGWNGRNWVIDNLPKKHMLAHRKKRIRKKWRKRLGLEAQRLMIQWAIAAAIVSAPRRAT